MRIRYLSYITLAVGAAFLVLATAAFPLSTVVWLAFGVGIGMLVVSLGIAVRYRENTPSLVVGVSIAAVSAWMVMASQAYSPATVDNLTFASALVIGALTLVGLTAHELSAERVVQSGAVLPEERESVDGPRAAAA
jgi:hypothetical protein